MLWRPIPAISPMPIATFCRNGTRSPSEFGAPGVLGTELGFGEDMAREVARRRALHGQWQRVIVRALPLPQAFAEFCDPAALGGIEPQVAQFAGIVGEVIKFGIVLAVKVELPAIGGDQAARVVSGLL